MCILVIAIGVARADEGVPLSQKSTAWLIAQAIPSVTMLTGPGVDATGFEWEITPVLYSFGMTRLVSPWSSFIVVPTARFSGSIELVASGLVFTRRAHGSPVAVSGQLLGHIPLIERGERLCANLGVAAYGFKDRSSLYAVVGVGTLFGLVHFNAKYDPRHSDWMGALELRLF